MADLFKHALNDKERTNRLGVNVIAAQILRGAPAGSALKETEALGDSGAPH